MRFRIDPADEPEIVLAIQSSAGVGTTYLTLLILSSVIATFGLLSNSTATVIGAMIVAPLMGPILGLALGLVQGDIKGFRDAFVAESLGVILCLATATFIVWLVGATHVDFAQSEILGRTRPTLLDLAIGFSAGLAGAYATVNRKISASIAGVAIAVALVPPLCVSGLCLGAGLLRQSAGAFVLFAANFLTIQLAATIVFAVSGLGHWRSLRNEHRLLQALLLNMVLLVVTGWFLAGQLNFLFAERRADRISREVISLAFSRISGANLDSLRVQLDGSTLRLDLLARAPEEMTVVFAQKLKKELESRLDYRVDLRIATALASYVTPDGRLFVPEKPAPDPNDVLVEDTQWALQKALKDFPGVELTGFRQVEVTPLSQRLFVTVRSSYLFDAILVARLQAAVIQRLEERQPGPKAVRLTVRTSLIQDFTVDGLQDVVIERSPTPEEVRRLDFERRAQVILRRGIERIKEARLVELRVDLQPILDGETLAIAVRIQSLRPVPRANIESWRKALQSQLKNPIELSITNDLGRQLTVPVSPSPGGF